MIIEADGEYWHSRPERIERDERLTAFAAERGYPLLRLGETFILGQSIAELGEVIRARCAELTTTSGMRGP
jgi:very-short-patch-repair endonuclease